jgi:hypothetical protein
MQLELHEAQLMPFCNGSDGSVDWNGKGVACDPDSNRTRVSGIETALKVTYGHPHNVGFLQVAHDGGCDGIERRGGG